MKCSISGPTGQGRAQPSRQGLSPAQRCGEISPQRAALPANPFGSPDGRVKMLDQNLVPTIGGGKDPDCGSAELVRNLVLTRGHAPQSSTHNPSGSPFRGFMGPSRMTV
jgi:hypothetical protein